MGIEFSIIPNMRPPEGPPGSHTLQYNFVYPE